MPSHPAIVEALLRPEAYPEKTSAVEMLDTHVSYIFFTDSFAYKVKKAVDYGFLDFTTLEKRRYYCHREVKLNRRLSPEAYLGVEEVRMRQGLYKIGGPGETVEYAVKMVRLPKHRALVHLLEGDQGSREAIRRLAQKIADFHRRAETSPEIARLGGLETPG